jgi:hypothetical protein
VDHWRARTRHKAGDKGTAESTGRSVRRKGGTVCAMRRGLPRRAPRMHEKDTRLQAQHWLARNKHGFTIDGPSAQ